MEERSGERVPPAEPVQEQEAQRNLPAIVTELGHRVMDGSAMAAAGWATKKVLDRVSGDRAPDAGPQDPGPADPPAGDGSP